MKQFLSRQKWSISNRALVLLSVMVLLVYSNTFHAQWHLDDYANIIHDSRIHLNDLTYDSIRHAVVSFTERPRDARPLLDDKVIIST